MSSENNIVILLLGAGGKYLDYRKKIKQVLVKKFGYKVDNILIMEEIEDQKNIMSIDQKFETIVRDYNPSLIIAFFHKNTRMDAVIFEIGFLCALYSSKNIGKKLRFTYDEHYNFRRTTSYISNLFTRVRCSPIIDGDTYFAPEKVIDAFVANLE